MAFASQPNASSSYSVGTCPSCLRSGLKITSTGVLHSHGPRGAHCPGTGRSPLLAFSSSQPLLTTSLNIHDGQSVIDGSGSGDASVSTGLVHNSTFSHPSSFIPIVKHIPKSARSTCCIALSSILNKIVSDPTKLDTWNELLSFGSRVLSNPPHAQVND